MQITDLKIGDIILTARSSEDSMISTVIMLGTASRFSHAMVYVGNGDVVEAVSDGVVSKKVGDATRGTSLAVAYRHSSVDASVGEKIAQFAYSKLGGEYAVPGVGTASAVVMATGLGVMLSAGRYVANRVLEAKGKKRSYFCSELVTDAYLNAGIVLGRYGNVPSMMNPGDLAEYSERNPTVLRELGKLLT